ncbi:RelA/SpoT domain-containing protein [Phaeobacter inhibens]|uniref:GTP pyrophosphokinase n=1 Tax=Phaeobacter inhibens TaxID=221822 RepID=UPI0021A67C50|nr:RelA/SpoT domain-containing protein [Phaeobacter inhibens]UWR78986.1 RelA/SpoT domain-containing protein [Phaeobacter inhibens]
MKKSEFIKEFDLRTSKFENLRRSAASIVEGILEEAGIALLQVQSRVKTKNSATEKFAEKDYAKPFIDMTDLVGLRVIVYLESDIDKSAKILRDAFEIDEEKSVDKRIPEKPDVVGYRSLHLICKLGKRRSGISEYRDVCDIFFEVQVRTALTHTWAEIEHKQNYKSAQALPKRLQRRLNILSGTLELVDLELDKIKRDAESYKDDLINESSDIDKDEITEISLRTLLNEHFEDNGVPTEDVEWNDLSTQLAIEDLKQCGITSVLELRQLLSDLPESIIFKYYDGSTSTKFAVHYVRIALMWKSPKELFENRTSIKRISKKVIDGFSEYWDPENIEELARENSIEIMDTTDDD